MQDPSGFCGIRGNAMPLVCLWAICGVFVIPVLPKPEPRRGSYNFRKVSKRMALPRLPIMLLMSALSQPYPQTSRSIRKV
jgi:hypothetical protein